METADIMIVTYNRLGLTKKTLNCLFENTKYPYRLIFVDNGSEDGTQEYLKKICEEKSKHIESFKDYKIKLNKKNKGIAIGRNQGLVLSESSWLVTFDNDVWVPKGWLGDCIGVLENNRQYAAIGVNMEGVNYPIIKSGGKEFQNKPQGNLGTACMVFNRSLHKMLGFFNHKDYVGAGIIKHYACEDSDYGWRIRVLGLKLGYIKENGKHLGEGELDKGEYRRLKTEAHNKNVPIFNANCGAYIRREKSLFIPFEDQDD